MTDSQSSEKPRWTIIELKEKIIDDGIVEVREVYADDEPKRLGAIEGFELARTLTTREEFEKVIRHRLMREMRQRQEHGQLRDLDRYWRGRWMTLQIEWVFDCLKVAYWAREGDMLSGRAARKVLEVIT